MRETSTQHTYVQALSDLRCAGPAPRQAPVLIDCPDTQLASAVTFWSAALGRAVVDKTDPPSPSPRLATLAGPPLDVLLQALGLQESRVHCCQL